MWRDLFYKSIHFTKQRTIMYNNTGHGREAEWVKTVAPWATSSSKGWGTTGGTALRCRNYTHTHTHTPCSMYISRTVYNPIRALFDAFRLRHKTSRYSSIDIADLDDAAATTTTTFFSTSTLPAPTSTTTFTETDSTTGMLNDNRNFSQLLKVFLQ